MMDEEQRRPDATADDEARPDEPQHDTLAQDEPRSDEPRSDEPTDAWRPGEPSAEAADTEVAGDDATTASQPGEEFETAPAGVSQEQAGSPGPLPTPADSDEPTQPPADGEPWRGEVPWPAETERPLDATPGGEPPPREAEAYVAAPATPAEPATATTPAHSVPATPIGESTLCPRCGTENRPGVAFCRSCGQRLLAPGVPTAVERPGTPEGTQACPRCGTHNRAGVAFCQNCGANLRAPASAASAAAEAPSPAAAPEHVSVAAVRGGAMLGPIVMLIGALGISVAWLLPFPFGADSLWARSFGTPGGYGIAFWSGYSAVSGGLADRTYFGFAAPAPILVLLLVALAVAGFLRAAPGSLQRGGLAVALVWSIGLGVLFILVEVGGAWGGDLVAMAKTLTPGGIIFLLASLIVILGTLTRFARS